MAFVYEVNGQKVEFEKEPSEADIDEAAKSLGQKPKPEATAGDVATMAVQAALPALTSSQVVPIFKPGFVGPVAPGKIEQELFSAAGYGLKPTGFNPQAVGQAMSPLKEIIPKTLARYAAPGGLGIGAVATDLGAMAFGAPPPVATFGGLEALKNLPGAVSKTAGEISKSVSTGTPGVSGKPETIDLYGELRDSLRNSKAGDIYEDVMKSNYSKGGNNAVLKGLENSDRFRAIMSFNPEVAEKFRAYASAVPSKLSQFGRAVTPVLRGAARVAGPVAIAMDINDAAQMARDTQLGERLAQGQGGRAEQAFRNMAVPYGGPQIDASQAQNVLQSGSARDIKYFGGQDNLREQMRKKAAARVTGPVAPGQQ